jgi:glycosyltransferase involved in cell wall biosynthesis
MKKPSTAALLAVTCFTADSGLTDYSVSLCRAMQQLNTTVFVTGRRLTAAYSTFGFDVVRLFRRSRWYPLDILAFAAWVLARRPAVLNWQACLKFPFLEALLVVLFEALGIRNAITVHDVLPHYPRPWSRFEFGLFYRRFSRIVAHSEAAARQLRELGVTAPILVVPHGVYDVFRIASPDRTTARRLIGLGRSPVETFVVLFFGNLESRKGLVELLRVAERLRGVSDLHFVVAGRNDSARHGGELPGLIDTARTAPNVTLHDQRVPFEAVENYFCAADLVALPYREGTTSGVLKLALAFGVPAVASRVGDFPEQLPVGAGELFEADGDMVASLQAAVLKARSLQVSQRAAMQAAATSCGWDDIARKYHDFLFD